jgi:hypothetical protein
MIDLNHANFKELLNPLSAARDAVRPEGILSLFFFEAAAHD